MGDFAIVLCATDTEVSDDTLLKNISLKVHKMLKKQKIEITSSRTGLYDNFSFHLIKLPYTLQQLTYMSPKRINRINALISDICYQNNLQSCILPKSISEICPFEECTAGAYNGSYLYRSMMLNILKEIYLFKGIKISDLDITIIHGQNYKELYCAINLLSPAVKYLTVIADEKKSVEEETEKICFETGLSIRVTADIKSGLKSADIIVNLSDLSRIGAVLKANHKAIVINYAGNEINRFLSENIIINGMDAELPPDLVKKIDKEVLRHFSGLELAEIVISHKKNLENIVREKEYDYSSMGKLSRCFKEDGYEVKGFRGRHTMLGTSELQRSIL